MVFLKTLVFAAILAVVNSRSVPDRYEFNPYELVFEPTNEEGAVFEDFETVYPEYHLRAKRQVHGAVSTNPDGSANIAGKLPLYNNGNNALSAIGTVDGAKPGGSFGAAGGGLAYDNVNGHGLSLTGKHIPGFGNQLTGAGKLNLVNTDRHNLNANAFIIRNLPTIPNAPNFNTHGGGLDYMYNNKIGASLSAAQTPLFQKTDVSAMGNLNLFRDRSSSLDFNAGATRSFSPFIPKSSWQPTFGLGYTRYF